MNEPADPPADAPGDAPGEAPAGAPDAGAGDVIESVEEATPGWLTSRLTAAGTLPPGGTVTGVRAELIGTGQMGVCARLHLTTNVAGPGSLVLKIASPNPGVRAFMGSSGYAGEVGFYRDLAAGVGITMPRSHHAAHDPATGGFTLLLDDLAPAVPGDQLDGISLAEAEVCMDELVRLHAPRWGDETLPDEPALAHMVQGEAMTQAVYGLAVPGFLDRFGHLLDAAGRELVELLPTGTDRWRSRGPSVRTLVHGDYRPDNLLFDRSTVPPRIAAVDWQGVRAGAGQIDIAFLLGTSLDPDLLEEHEEDLLRRWFDGLAAAGVRGYTWEACLADLGWAAVGALQTTVFGAAFSEPSERGEEMFARMLTGQVRQILRLAAVDLLRP